jgi:bacterial/archaeal transporter family-2 protein
LIDPTLAVALMLVVGAQLALQAPVNAGLGSATGSLPAALVSFLGGTVILGAAALIGGTSSELWELGDVDWYYLLGGMAGALYVLTAAATVPRIGAGGVAAGTITGQLLGSMVVDAAGILGLEGRPITPARALGAVALVLGSYLIVARRGDARPAGANWRQIAGPMAAMIAASATVAVQHPVNARLADSIQGVPAAFTSFVVGSIVLAVAVVATGTAGRLRAATRVNPIYLTGGVFGSINAFAALSTVDEIGAGAVAAATITGQLVASIALDRVGFLGLERKPVSAMRLLAASLLGAGTYLIVG